MKINMNSFKIIEKGKLIEKLGRKA